MVLNRQLLHEMNKILSFCACSAFAISSDATSSLERLKSAHGQRRKIGRNFCIRNCGVNNDSARLGYWSPHGMPQLREHDVGPAWEANAV